MCVCVCVCGREEGREQNVNVLIRGRRWGVGSSSMQRGGTRWRTHAKCAYICAGGACAAVCVRCVCCVCARCAGVCVCAGVRAAVCESIDTCSILMSFVSRRLPFSRKLISSSTRSPMLCPSFSSLCSRSDTDSTRERLYCTASENRNANALRLTLDPPGYTREQARGHADDGAA